MGKIVEFVRLPLFSFIMTFVHPEAQIAPNCKLVALALAHFNNFTLHSPSPSSSTSSLTA